MYLAGEKDYLRGVLLYKNVLDSELSDAEASLQEWFVSIMRVDTKIAQQYRDGIKFLRICYEIQLNSENARNTVKNVFGNIQKIDNLDIFNPNAITYTKEYRRAVQSLIFNDKEEFLADFISATKKYNVDRFTYYGSLPQKVNKQLQTGLNPQLLSEALINNTSKDSTAIYVYLNSFVRGIIPLQMLVNQLLTKYDIVSIQRSFKQYNFGIQLIPDTGSDKILVRPMGIICSRRLYLSEESAEIVRKDSDMLSEDLISQIISINPNNNVVKFALVGHTEDRIENIIIFLNNIVETQEVDDTIIEVARGINLALISKTSPAYIAMSVRLLDAITVLASAGNEEKIVNLVENVRNANYFYLLHTSGQSARNLKGIEPDRFRQIWNDCNILLNSTIDISTCFYIYCNTIMRRAMTLSKFMSYFVAGRNVPYDEFITSLSKLTGIIIGTHTDIDNNTLIIFMAPNAFCMSTRSKDKQIIKDKYIYKLKMNPEESITSVRKKNSISKGMWVEFFIDDFDGENTFTIRKYQLYKRNVEFKIPPKNEMRP